MLSPAPQERQLAGFTSPSKLSRQTVRLSHRDPVGQAVELWAPFLGLQIPSANARNWIQ